MGQLSAADASRAGLRPHRRHTVGRGGQDLDGVAAPEALSGSGVGETHAHTLTGQRVPHEDDAALVPRHAVPTVGHALDVDLHLGGDVGAVLLGRHYGSTGLSAPVAADGAGWSPVWVPRRTSPGA